MYRVRRRIFTNGQRIAIKHPYVTNTLRASHTCFHLFNTEALGLSAAYFRSFCLTDGTHSGSQTVIFYDHQYHAKTHPEWAKNLLPFGMGKRPRGTNCIRHLYLCKPKEQLQRNHPLFQQVIMGGLRLTILKIYWSVCGRPATSAM